MDNQMIKVDANDLKKLILNVELIKEILLSKRLYSDSEKELAGWTKNGIEEASDFPENIKEDLEFARRTEEAWKSYERGEFISMSGDEFEKELEKW
ncbi:MAG: hypothetical protein ABIF18_02325 [archaeon]